MKSRILLIAGLSATALILANTMPLPFDLVGSTAADAKDGGNGNGGGNGGGHGNSGDHSASLGGSPGNSGNHGGSSGGKKHGPTGIASHGHGKLKANGGVATGKAHVKTDDSLIAEADPTEKEKSLDARLGALHVINADLHAFMNANGNSRVGRLAAYAKALVAEEDAMIALDPSINLLLTNNPLLTDADLRLLENPSNTSQIEAFIAARSVADERLATAANKPVDADVKAYVDDKLEENGILDLYR